MSRIRILIVLIGLFASQFGAHASELDAQRNVQKIRFIVGTKQVKIAKEFSELENSLKGDHFKIKHPHEILNSKAALHDYTGLSFERILENSGLNREQIRKLHRSPVSFIGRDGYTVSMPLFDVLNVRAFISNRQSGVLLDWRKGAPFLAFAETDKVPYLAEQSWWAWWVSAIVVGDIEPTLNVFGKRNTMAAIEARCRETKIGVLNYPRGRRKTELPGGFKGTITSCGFDQILGTVPPENKNKSKIIAHFLSGQIHVVDNPQKYEVVTKFNDSSIPASFGGPYQLCEREGKLECRYFLERIGWSE